MRTNNFRGSLRGIHNSKNVGYNHFSREDSMAKLTELIRFALTPELFRRIHKEAQQQKISVSELVRRAVERYLRESNERRRILGRHADIDPKKLNSLNSPLVAWTATEEQFAHQVIQRHCDEDR